MFVCLKKSKTIFVPILKRYGEDFMSLIWLIWFMNKLQIVPVNRIRLHSFAEEFENFTIDLNLIFKDLIMWSNKLSKNSRNSC